jgi:hypothetical protein
VNFKSRTPFVTGAAIIIFSGATTTAFVCNDSDADMIIVKILK